MAKINRYDGNLLPFAKNFTGGNRTIFGETTQSDDLTDNINTKFLQGWEATTDANTFPTKQDFNAVSYVSTALASYLHQVGIPEWNAKQEYHENSFVNYNGVLYRCKTNNHTSVTDPASDTVNWEDVIGDNVVKLTDNQTINGIKTFTSSPVVPTPTTGSQSANKTYVDTQINGLGTAATRDVGESAGNVMEVGAFGVGASPENGQIRSWVLPTFYFGESGIDDEYLVLFPSEASGPHAIKGEFHGSRGSSTTANISIVQFINAQSAYNSNNLSSWYKERARFIRFSILSIDGVSYVALKGALTGGPNHNQNVFYGNVIGGDARLFTRVRASDSNVTVVSDNVKTVDSMCHTGNIKTALNATGTAPIYACRAWVNFNGIGTVAIRASGNVSSITDNGVGDYTVNFTTAMPDTNYSVAGSVQRNQDGSADGNFASIKRSTTYNSLLSTSARVQAGDTAGALQDPLVCCILIFR
jgi:hypothetical protein